jgi:hypothetical protein
MNISVEQAISYFIDQRRFLIDNFGEEKHPEKIAAVTMAIEALQRDRAQPPVPVGLADRHCPCCGSWLPFDYLNGSRASAPKRCTECGQKLLWKGNEQNVHPE